MDAHNWGVGKITVMPTPYTEGVVSFTCDTCDAVNEFAVEKLPMLEIVTNDPNVTDAYTVVQAELANGCQSVISGSAITLLLSTATAVAFIPKKKKRE